MSDKVGLPTLTDIMAELEKPGRDPRQAIPHIKDAKSVADISKKLKKVKGYQSFVGGDTASYIAEIAKYKALSPLSACGGCNSSSSAMRFSSPS